MSKITYVSRALLFLVSILIFFLVSGCGPVIKLTGPSKPKNVHIVVERIFLKKEQIVKMAPDRKTVLFHTFGKECILRTILASRNEKPFNFKVFKYVSEPSLQSLGSITVDSGFEMVDFHEDEGEHIVLEFPPTATKRNVVLWTECVQDPEDIEWEM